MFERVKAWLYPPPYSLEAPYPFYPEANHLYGDSLQERQAWAAKKEMALCIEMQRQSHKSAELSTERRVQLETLPHWRWASPAKGAQQAQDRDWFLMMNLWRKAWPSHKDNVYRRATPSNGTLATKMERDLAAWFSKQASLLRASRVPQRRLRQKTKAKPRMPAHHISRFEKYWEQHVAPRKNLGTVAFPPETCAV